MFELKVEGGKYKVWFMHYREEVVETICFIALEREDGKNRLWSGSSYAETDDFARDRGRKEALARALKRMTPDKYTREIFWVAYLEHSPIRKQV